MSTSVPNPNPKYLWRNVSRVEVAKRSATERIADFLEVYGYLDEETARAQASRCLQCPDPPCVAGCPMGNCIPQWLALVAERHFQEASELLGSSGCMPDLVSRLCRQPCEESCVLEKMGSPIAINAIERFLNHYAQEHELSNLWTQPPNGHRVAVVGSGPGALACCLELVRSGHTVTVFDSHPIPGGFMVQNIPAFKLDKTLVQARIRQLQHLGVEFRMNVQWGRDISLQALRAQYGAVFLGPCAEKPRSLTIPGADLGGVYQGLQFLVQKNFPWASELALPDLKGKRVIVLGGGDTAIDCLRTAIRCGAEATLCLYRRDQASMPCDPRQYQEAREEGAQFQFFTLPTALAGSDAGQVTTISCVRTQPGALDATRRPQPILVPGSEFAIPVDIVLVAHGFVPPPILAEDEFTGLAVNESGGLAVDDNQMTSLPGVFAAGVLVRQSLLLPETVRHAREAARGIERFLCTNQVAGVKCCSVTSSGYDQETHTDCR